MASTLGELLMVKPESPGGVSLDQSRRQTLEALRSVADTLLNDREHGAAVRHYKQISEMIREMESGSMAGWDPLLAARAELEHTNKWLPVKELARRLHLKDVQASATMNKPKKPLQRRQLTNIERLERLILQAINHERLQGCKRMEDNLEVTLAGLVGWTLPAGARKMEAKGQNAGRKPKRGKK